MENPKQSIGARRGGVQNQTCAPCGPVKAPSSRKVSSGPRREQRRRSKSLRAPGPCEMTILMFLTLGSLPSAPRSRRDRVRSSRQRAAQIFCPPRRARVRGRFKGRFRNSARHAGFVFDVCRWVTYSSGACKGPQGASTKNHYDRWLLLECAQDPGGSDACDFQCFRHYFRGPGPRRALPFSWSTPKDPTRRYRF